MASDSAAIALGIPPLRRAAIAEGAQEIRIWSGVEIGAERELVRLTRSHGTVEGTFARYWRLADTPHRSTAGFVAIDSVVRYSVAGQCGPFRRSGGTEACLMHLIRRPPWRTMWDSLVRLGVWTLPDQSSLARDSVMVFDGWSMTIELRDGPYYRSYAYSNPGAHKAAPQVAAAAIGNVPRPLWSMLAVKTNDHIIGGRLDVRRITSEFTPCGSTTVWAASNWYGPTLDSILKTIPAGDTLTRRPRYAVLRGMMALPELLRSWRSPYAAMLQVDSVIQVAEWSSARCGGTDRGGAR